MDLASPEQLIDEAVTLLEQRDFNGALAKYGVAYRAVEQIKPDGARLYYRAVVQLGIATALSGEGRYQEALLHADAALAAAPNSQNPATPAPLKAMIHHARGAILYDLGRSDEARAMFEFAAREGDAGAAGWLRAIAGAP